MLFWLSILESPKPIDDTENLNAESVNVDIEIELNASSLENEEYLEENDYIETDDDNLQTLDPFAQITSPTKKYLTDCWLFRSHLAINETEKEFKLFQSFLELGGGRSINYISLIFNLSYRTIYEIYKKNNWKIRSSEYDRYLLTDKLKIAQETRQKEHLQKLETYRKEQEFLGRKLTLNAAKIATIADHTLNAMLEADRGIDIRDIPSILNAAAKLADIGKQLQSSALGVDQLLIALEESEID